ncbi:MAG: N-acetylglucosamine kinase [Alphaproteobacteria bacterium]|nr:N-acetylglucosamine kinase [Alphaproteobacteria bacterium]
MPAPLFLGIDGGGTSCRARLCSGDGSVLGEGCSGPANVRLGLEAAFKAVLYATNEALASAGLDATAFGQIHAGLGLAGVNLDFAFKEALAYPLPFARAALATDIEIARLGAHGGGDGGVVIAGTGSCAEGRIGTKAVRLGGWGFALGDQGSGAAIGRAALRHGLLAHDGLIASSALAGAVMAEFGDDPEAAVRWAESARPRDYAGFGPLLLAHVDKRDPAAIAIIQDAAAAIDCLIYGLAGAGVEPIALLGGMANGLRPWLAEDAAARLIEPKGTALDGAVFLARDQAGMGEPR